LVQKRTKLSRERRRWGRFEASVLEHNCEFCTSLTKKLDKVVELELHASANVSIRVQFQLTLIAKIYSRSQFTTEAKACTFFM
jgi:hypothetical protein